MNSSTMSTPGPDMRRRRRIFSTSITASSTTTPSATTSPPSVIVLSDSPKASRIHTVVSKASGIALNETSAPRQSRNMINRSATTSTAPMSSELRSFSIALSMKLAGRSSAGWYSTPCLASAGAIASSLSSRARVTSRVLAPNCVEVSMRMPGFPAIKASPKRGSAPSRTVARSPRRTGKPLRVPTTAAPSASIVAPGACAWITIRCVGVSR